MNNVQYTLKGHVAWIIIDRPAVRNAVDYQTALDLRAAVHRSERDDEVWVSVIRGAGDAAFSAGADLKAMAAGGARPVVEPGGFAGITRLARTKPLVAAVNGVALGGGFELALACDLVVAVADATFALLETRRGIIAAGGALVHLARQLPHALAADLAIAGRALSAAEAQAYGLVNRVAERPLFDAAVDKLLADIQLGAPLAVRESLQVLEQSRYLDLATSWQVSNAAADRIRGTADAREGPRAFVERRRPTWAAR